MGILGGGQLGRMLAMAAARLGLRTAIYDPDPDCPAAQVASHRHRGSFDDDASLAEFALRCDWVTYEFENIPAEAIDTVLRHAPVFPGRRALETSQDRLEEKRFVSRLGINTAPFFEIGGNTDLRNALARCEDGILKTRRFGYDGKGQLRLSTGNRSSVALRKLLDEPCIFEGFVDFRAEISVVAARAGDGSFAAYDPALNRHLDGILRQSSVPAPISDPVGEEATEITRSIMVALDYVGVIGVEFFVTHHDGLLVNEFAPRVHNSGHWTEAACAVSQFENHVRAVCGLPLGEPGRHSDCEMFNIIGEEVEQAANWMRQPECHLHLYGKRETRPNRKMGHVTRIISR